MSVRTPAMAGRFYPVDANQCRQLVKSYFSQAASKVEVRHAWIGGVVPHAGWICSAAIAAETIYAIAQQSKPDVVVVFGAVHTPLPLRGAALDTHDTWAVPTGPSQISMEISRKLLELRTEFSQDERFHRHEHAVEVEVPLIQQAFESTAILPIEVAADAQAVGIGRQTAETLKSLNLNAVFLASSDLTHYGPDYGFTPAGIGPAALDWASDNDRRLLDAVLKLSEETIVQEAKSRYNACGAGAIAAMLAAAKEFGASQSQLISHTNSFKTLMPVAPQPPTNAVGYASLVVG
ncbi:MAG TPA: AmmeMemoRadiSam system protein B [Tepidisphaeraceae bacterium]|nr:AmmeMemoRadiSam system protein B [Tepidisphaeraceae bacterium]